MDFIQSATSATAWGRLKIGGDSCWTVCSGHVKKLPFSLPCHVSQGWNWKPAAADTHRLANVKNPILACPGTPPRRVCPGRLPVPFATGPCHGHSKKDFANGLAGGRGPEQTTLFKFPESPKSSRASTPRHISSGKRGKGPRSVISFKIKFVTIHESNHPTHGGRIWIFFFLFMDEILFFQKSAFQTSPTPAKGPNSCFQRGICQGHWSCTSWLTEQHKAI